MYDFDTIVNRHGTDSIKFDGHEKFGIPQENLSLWVADMDFPTAPGISEALQKAVTHGIYGYTAPGQAYYDAVRNWYRKRFDWETKRNWIVPVPGVVFALSAAVRAFTKPGDKVLIQQPVYYPFGNVIRENGREVVNSPLRLVEGAAVQAGGSGSVQTDAQQERRPGSAAHYEMDFADLEEKLADPGVRLFILCSPHNPVGRVWTKEELCILEELCLKNDVIVVSDEIHGDFAWDGSTHHILASLDARYEQNTVICTAPSKTFNLAGLQASNIFIPDRELRQRYRAELERISAGQPNQLGQIACRAAYETGERWLDAVRQYIQDNIDFADLFLQENIPALHLIRPEGTYLLWIDCRRLGLSEQALEELIVKKAHLWLDAGTMFGEEGSGFERINAACPRAYLKQALEQLAEAVKGMESGIAT